MSSVDLIIVVLTIIGTGIAAVLVTVAVSSLVRAHRIRMEPSLGDARQAIVEALSGGDAETDRAFSVLSRFSDRYVAEVMLDMAPSVTGTSRSVMVVLGERTGMLRHARIGVRRRRWSTRLYSARVLSAFGVETEELPRLMTDRSPEVRAQAAAWAVIAPKDESLAGLIGLLGDTDGLCRFAAQDALIRIGLPASDSLISALDRVDGEVTQRILEVATAMGDGRFYRPAVELVENPSPETRALAAAVLARTGSPQAGPELVRLLEDPSEVVVLAAAVGIAKLAYWPGCVEIEPLLSHPSWELRRQAGVTLLALGAPGVILLRSAAPGEGPAAEIATQALQLQSLSSLEVGA